MDGVDGAPTTRNMGYWEAPDVCERTTMKGENRPYQRKLVREATEYLDGGGNSVLIESPTGSGKSFMGLRLMEHYGDLGYSLAWAAMRRNLLKQIEREAAKFNFKYDFKCVSMFDKRPEHADFLVCDEAHHDATESMANVHAKMCPNKVVGLSATPQRQDRVSLCFEKTLKGAAIKELVGQGYLSRYHHYTIKEFTPQQVADTFLMSPEKWGKSLVFWHQYHECMEFQQCLRDRGFMSSEIVTQNTDRDAQIEKFESGETQILINMLILTEGFDSASLRTCFIRRSSRLPTQQMAGRVFRKFPGIEFKQIVQCERTKYPVPRYVPPAAQFKLMSGEWRRVELHKGIEQIANRSRMLMIQATERFIRSGQVGAGIGDHTRVPQTRQRRYANADND